MGKEIALVLLIGHAMLSTHTVEAAGIKIAAYNIRIFGSSKLQNQVAMNMITQVFNSVTVASSEYWLVKCMGVVWRLYRMIYSKGSLEYENLHLNEKSVAKLLSLDSMCWLV